MARNILVVEDDRNISDLIRMYMEKEGFEVRSAYDGGKAIEEFEKQAPDLVLLDIMLPVMDGWAVCSKIRETSKVPIIMLTFKDVKLKELLTLDKIYEIKAIDDNIINLETKVSISTVQGLLKRTILAEEPDLMPGAFDLIIVDEAHRGYILDRGKV